MLKIHLTQNQGFSWFSSKLHQPQNTNCKGFIFDATANYVEQQAAADALTQYLQTPDTFTTQLQKIDGCFAVVIESNDWLLAAVDRLRTLPLFYAQTETTTYLTDEADWLRQQLSATHLDPINVHEYELTGYVIGNETLYPTIKQLRAGEYLFYDKTTQHLTIQSYFTFQRQNFFTQNNEVLIEQLDQIHERVFQRLITSLQGRTAVIPLSGGYDSRLIAVMLKRLGYENVICFSYGREGNWESSTSKKIADYLGYPWHYVNYHLKKWRTWYLSEQRQAFYDFSQYHTAMPYIQDLLAVTELKQQGILPQDAVFVPGHSGDFLAGSHISYELLDGRPLSGDELVNLIYKYHYSLWQVKPERKKQLFDHKMQPIRQLELSTQEKFSVAADTWDWQERQAKFIVNSVRAFEFHGFEWRLPLWDYELIEFWSHIDFDRRLGRALYMQYVDRYQGEMNQTLQLSRQGIETAMLKKPAADLFSVLLRRTSNFPHYLLYYFKDKLQITGTIAFSQFLIEYFNGAKQGKSILIKNLLNDIANRNQR